MKEINVMEFREQIKKIYNHMGNDLSKEIYINRLLYSLTEDNKYMRNVIETTYEGRQFISKLYCDKKKIIFSAGAWGKEIITSYPDVEFEGFIDNRVKNDQTDEECLGYPVISYDKYLKEYAPNTIVIIASRLYYDEIYNQLKSDNISDEYILNAGKMIDDMSVRQYFDLPEMENRRLASECFIDAGSFDGRTSSLFYKWCQKNINSKEINIWAFEPDKNNLEKCKKTLALLKQEKNRRVEYQVIQKGLWDSTGTISFSSVQNGTSKITNTGEDQIFVDRLDKMIPKDEEVTFVKMDLEGSEYKALLGAEEIIKKYKPKLAISIYHKPEDIWELPELVLSMNPQYKLYLGHYSTAAAETVLYAL